MVARLRGRQSQNTRALSKSHNGECRAGAVRDLVYSAGAGVAVSGQAVNTASAMWLAAAAGGGVREALGDPASAGSTVTVWADTGMRLAVAAGCEAGHRTREQWSVFANPGNDFDDVSDLFALALRFALPPRGSIRLGCSSRGLVV